jgi:hypothetical protein
MRARDYSPRSRFHADAKILDGWSAIRKYSKMSRADQYTEALGLWNVIERFAM